MKSGKYHYKDSRLYLSFEKHSSHIFYRSYVCTNTSWVVKVLPILLDNLIAYGMVHRGSIGHRPLEVAIENGKWIKLEAKKKNTR